MSPAPLPDRPLRSKGREGFFVGKVGCEVSVQHIRGNIEAVMTISCGLVFVGSGNINTIIAHQTANAAVTNA